MHAKLQSNKFPILPIIVCTDSTFPSPPHLTQIMAESADQCCQALIRQSASHRLMPILVAAAVREKNSKIRGLCCGYVALVRWEGLSRLRPDTFSCSRARRDNLTERHGAAISPLP